MESFHLDRKSCLVWLAKLQGVTSSGVTMSRTYFELLYLLAIISEREACAYEEGPLLLSKTNDCPYRGHGIS